MADRDGEELVKVTIRLPKALVKSGKAVAMALAPQVWTQPGDGVLFLIGVSDGHSYQTLQSIVIDPHGARAAERWHDATFSLEEYAGLTVDIILNTRAGEAPTATTLNDVAVWGAPRVVAR